MDPFDTFYQHLDSERLLEQHGDTLANDARAILAKTSDARLAGVILLPDSREAAPLRAALAKLTGRARPRSARRASGASREARPSPTSAATKA